MHSDSEDEPEAKAGNNPKEYPHAILPVAKPQGKTLIGKATFNINADGQTRDCTHHQAHLTLLHSTRYKDRT